MRFSEDYTQLPKHFTLEADQLLLPESNIVINNYNFETATGLSSNNTSQGEELNEGNKSDNIKIQNIRNFRYSIFSEKEPGLFSKAIVLLLGLNENKWDKYLCWAKYLVETTHKPVILFPILFYIDNMRPEKDWQKRLINRKRGLYQSNKQSNKTPFAISQRLSHLPERVTKSGFRSICDIVKLTSELHEGSHPLFKQGTTVDLFGYSIGAFIAQILLLANPKNLYEKSKFLFFCGGSFFSSIIENSRLNMDQSAFMKLPYYVDCEIKERYTNVKKYLDTLSFENISLAFKTMLSAEKFKRYREKVYKQFCQQIHAITLVKDSFIPPGQVYTSLRGKGGVIPVAINVLDYPYSYTHESPFPIGRDFELNSTIDSCFNSTFTMVSNFLRDR